MQPCGPTVQQNRAYELLQDYANNGCPVNCGPNWFHDQIMEVLRYGAHPSAQHGEALKCLEAEAMEKEREGFVHISKWKDLKEKIPPKFKLSPIAMILHKSRKSCAILDLSFCLRTVQPADCQGTSVNEQTIAQVPHQAMD